MDQQPAPPPQPTQPRPVQPMPPPPQPADSPYPQLSAEEIKARHDESQARYPQLRMHDGEYVIEEVDRHPIGLISIWLVAGIIMLIVLAIIPVYSMNRAFLAQLFLTHASKMPSPDILVTPVLLLLGITLLGGLIATIVYRGNRFYLTSESIVQHVQYSLFSTKQQVVNLINVEDASCTQFGIIEQLLNYGTLRLSTQGQETIYRFRYVANPKKVVDDVNDATESAVKRLEGRSNYPPSEF